MTDDVASLVLRNNYQQTLAISLEAMRGQDNLGNQMRLMAELEERGLLDREVEDLPDDAALEERAADGHGLTRAEIGTLLAFAKIALFNDLVDSVVPDDPYLGRELFRYFPAEMRERFADEIEAHRLRREIIATQLANSVINRGGPTLLVAARDRTGDSPADLTRAYAAVRDSFALQDAACRASTRSTRRSPGTLQLELYAIAQDVLVDRIAWFASNIDPTAGLAEIVAHYRAALDELAGTLPTLLSREAAKAVATREDRLKAGGVPERAGGAPGAPADAGARQRRGAHRRAHRAQPEGGGAVLLRHLRPLRLRPHRRHDGGGGDGRILRGAGAAEGARQPGDGAPRPRPQPHLQWRRHRRGGLGGRVRRAHHRHARARWRRSSPTAGRRWPR